MRIDNVSRVFGTLACFALLLGAAGSAEGYVGTLTSGDGGLHGSGNWIENGPTRIDWEVAYDAGAGWWTYSYELSHPAGETSHLLLEVSPNFGEDDIFNLSGDFDSIEIGTFGANPSNPGIPGPIYAVKFDDAWGLTTRIRFASYRVPVWGDFYAKSGRVGGNWNAAWNAGFLADDPTDPAGDGSLAGHILVPDSVTEPIPEPGTVLLLGLGLLGLGGISRKRSANRA